MTIPLRKLGSSGPLVPAIGLGCMSMCPVYVYGAFNPEESLRVLDKAIKSGCIFWDTADVYPNNEEFLSQVVKPNRDKIFICTKFGIDFSSPTGVNGKREHVRKQCEQSLSRLGIDVIDLYYNHRIDTDVPIEETVGAMAELVKEGKVRYLGLSECSAATLRRAHAVHPIAAVQIEYSPWCTEIETNGLLATCRELGVAIVAYSPLSRGFLTGQLKSPDDFAADDFRRQCPRFQGENFYKNLDIIKEFEIMAKKKGVPTSQLVLAWILAQGEDFIIIPGTKTEKYFEENIAAVNVHLTTEEVLGIRKIVNSATWVGERYPAQLMAVINKDQERDH